MGSENQGYDSRHRTYHGIYRRFEFGAVPSRQKKVDAVIRNFEILGEAAAHVPEEIVFDYPDVPWQDIRDMRNLLAHEYFGVNEEIVWETIQKDLSSLIVQ